MLCIFFSTLLTVKATSFVNGEILIDPKCSFKLSIHVTGDLFFINNYYIPKLYLSVYQFFTSFLDLCSWFLTKFRQQALGIQIGRFLMMLILETYFLNLNLT